MKKRNAFGSLMKAVIQSPPEQLRSRSCSELWTADGAELTAFLAMAESI